VVEVRLENLNACKRYECYLFTCDVVHVVGARSEGEDLGERYKLAPTRFCTRRCLTLGGVSAIAEVGEM
jgi:hypothetical protein